MPLNINKDTVYRAAKPKDKDYNINDRGGVPIRWGNRG